MLSTKLGGYQSWFVQQTRFSCTVYHITLKSTCAVWRSKHWFAHQLSTCQPGTTPRQKPPEMPGDSVCLFTLDGMYWSDTHDFSCAIPAIPMCFLLYIYTFYKWILYTINIHKYVTLYIYIHVMVINGVYIYIYTHFISFYIIHSYTIISNISISGLHLYTIKIHWTNGI